MTLPAALLVACSGVDVTVFEDPPPGVDEGPATGGSAPIVVPGGSGPGPDHPGGASGSGGEVSVLVDDFEDEDKKALDPAGWWYGVDDGTGTQTISVISSTDLEAPSSANGSFVLQVTSEGFLSWGAAFGLDVGAYNFNAGSLEVSFAAAADREITIALHALDGSGTHFVTNFTIAPTWTTTRVRLDDLFVVEADAVRWFDVATLDELQWFVYGEQSSTVLIDDVSFRSF